MQGQLRRFLFQFRTPSHEESPFACLSWLVIRLVYDLLDDCFAFFQSHWSCLSDRAGPDRTRIRIPCGRETLLSKARSQRQVTDFIASDYILMILDQRDVFRPWSLGSLSCGVGDSLSFSQFIEAHAFNIRVVEEHVLVRAGINETETLVRQSLDRTFSHSSHFLKRDSATHSETTRSEQDFVARTTL